MKCKAWLFSFIALHLGAIAAFGLTADEARLLAAANSNDLVKMRALIIQAGVNLDAINEYGDTALNLAAGNGHLKAVKLLIEEKADVNKPNPSGYTALHYAVNGKHLETVTFLIERGAGVNLANRYGETPLHIATQGEYFEMTKLLIEHGAHVQTPNTEGYTPLHAMLTQFSPGALMQILRLPETQKALRELDAKMKYELHAMLLDREKAEPMMMPTIEYFEAFSGFKSQGAGIQEAIYNPWHLVQLLKREGVVALQAYTEGKTIVGIATLVGLTFDNIFRVARHYHGTQADLMICAYVNREVIDALGIEHFAGFILPGASDCYPKDLTEFRLQDLPVDALTQTDHFYQWVYAQAEAACIPTFGICAGAQHLVFKRAGALAWTEESKTECTFSPFHVLHFMCLNETERRQVLEKGDEVSVIIDVFRAHQYAPAKEGLGNCTLEGTTPNGTPMAWCHGPYALATQFHPEARYEGISNYGNETSRARQTRLLNSFFELCLQHQAFIDWAKGTSKERKEGLDRRDAANTPIFERLRALRERREGTVETKWEGEVEFMKILPGVQEAGMRIHAMGAIWGEAAS